MFKRKGGGGAKAFWTMLKKLHFSYTIASLTYENQWGKWRTKIQYFVFFWTPYWLNRKQESWANVLIVWTFYSLINQSKNCRK